jgi:hypothetical protein
MIEQATEQLSQVANVREQFAKRGFKFTDGTWQGMPRHFGIAKGCTLELVGEGAIHHVTMVAIMAPDAQDTARLNGFRMAGLLAILAGTSGVEWVGWAMGKAKEVPGSKVTIRDNLGNWAIVMVVNRAKSVITLKVSEAQP